MTYKGICFVMSIVLYFSIMFGVWLKFSMYGVKHKKLISAIIAPFFLVLASTYYVWTFVDTYAKTESLSTKTSLMYNVFKINMKCFPVVVGLLAYSYARAEANAEAQEKRMKIKVVKVNTLKDTEYIFRGKSYELYQTANIA